MDAARPEERGAELAVVVIGRNEGSRLARALRSVAGAGRLVVYVDSGSTDDSVAVAEREGAVVHRLDPTRPFSAARARNEGVLEVLARRPEVGEVQFVDGDCEMLPGWWQAAQARLIAEPRTAVVCGRVRERNRGATVYNRLCDLEFHRAPGIVASCGGIFMARVEAFREVGGFDERVTAGEEPEMCLRLRRKGHTIARIPEDMCLHDSAMTRFGQWWMRSVRSGYAYALGAAMHGQGPERYCVRDCRSILAWTLVPPLAAAALAWPTGGLSLLVLLVYPLQALRIAGRRRLPGESPGDRVLFGAACVIAKFAQLHGVVRAWAGRGQTKLIEYK